MNSLKRGEINLKEKVKTGAKNELATIIEHC